MKIKPVAAAHRSHGRLACIVLGADRGTRMRSSHAKALHMLLGAPLITYAIDRARSLKAAKIVVVLGHQRDQVERALHARYGKGTLTIVEPKGLRGPDTAVRAGLSALPRFIGTLLILPGDAPLLSDRTLRALVDAARRAHGLAVLTARTGAGQGRDARIYAAPAAFLRRAITRPAPEHVQGKVTTIQATAAELTRIDNRRHLSEAEAVWRRRVIDRHMRVATFRDPDSCTVERDVVIDADVEIGRNVTLRGRTHIRKDARIGDGVVLINTDVGAGTEIKPYCVAEDARVAGGCKIGPFAHLRPGSDLGTDVHIGNFVETKKARLGPGSKANHLSYLGDATIGARVNIGAGTITCNYNGHEKRRTVIGDEAFIGSDSQLIAPVTIGKRAVIGAGATITRNVPAGTLALSRVAQTHTDGYAERLARRYAGGASKRKPHKRAR